MICLYFCMNKISAFPIANDNMDFQLDKKAHLGVSFGLYYTFYTLSSDTLIPSITANHSLDALLTSTIVGFTYEVYQSTPISKSNGFSKHDMIYNLIGIGLAKLSHEFFLYFKDLI